MNKVILMGRITADPEIRYLQGQDNSVAKFSIAVNRRFKAAGEEQPAADFIRCEAWNRTAEFIGSHFKKGNMIAVVGRIVTGSYVDKDGRKIYTTDVRVEEAYFTGEKAGSSANNAAPEPSPVGDGFMNIPEGLDEELPFN